MVLVSVGREVEADSRGYRSAEEQARELTRSIRREVNKLSEKWNALIDRSDQWQRKLDDSLTVSQYLFVTPADIRTLETEYDTKLFRCTVYEWLLISHFVKFSLPLRKNV